MAKKKATPTPTPSPVKPKKKSVHSKVAAEVGTPAFEIDPTKFPRRVSRSPFVTNGQRKEWEPSALQWSIYEAIVRGGKMRAVAAQFSAAGHQMNHQNVGQICKRIDEYLAQHHMDNVRAIRARHTQHLEHIFSEAMEGWERSKNVAITEEFEKITVDDQSNDSADGLSVFGDPEEKEATKTKRKEVHQCGAPAFLNEARAALADIRKIHAADKNPKVRDDNEGEDDERVAGKSREVVIDEHIQRLQASKKALQALGGGNTAGTANQDQAG